MGNWNYIRSYSEMPEAVFAHCDTRDFHMICHSESTRDIQKTIKKIKKTIRKLNNPESYTFKRSEILGILKRLEELSGGCGEWRYLSVKGYESWLKYIRFYQIEGDEYFGYTSFGDDIIPLSREVLIDPTVLDEYLNFIPHVPAGLSESSNATPAQIVTVDNPQNMKELEDTLKQI